MENSSSNKVHFQTSLSAISGYMLYKIRRGLGLNQRQMAKIFDISNVTYSSIERGDTSINVDFIYIICSFVGYKFSDYFLLIDDIVNELKQITICSISDNIEVNIIPSSDILKIIKNGYDFGIGISVKEHNLILNQDFNFFLSKDLLNRLNYFEHMRLTSEQIKIIENLTFEELEKNELIFSGKGALALGGMGMASGFLGAVLGLNVISVAVGLGGLGGYELFKAYKKNKEDKKK